MRTNNERILHRNSIFFNDEKLELIEYYNDSLADLNPKREDIDVFGFKFINITKGIEFNSVDDEHLISNLETIYDENDALSIARLLLCYKQECFDCGGAGYSYDTFGDRNNCESCDGTGIE